MRERFEDDEPQTRGQLYRRLVAVVLTRNNSQCKCGALALGIWPRDPETRFGLEDFGAWEPICHACALVSEAPLSFNEHERAARLIRHVPARRRRLEPREMKTPRPFGRGACFVWRPPLHRGE